MKSDRNRYSRDLAAATLAHVRDDAPLYLMIVLYTLAGLSFLRAAGAQDQAAYAIYVVKWISLFALMLPLIALALDGGLLVHRFDRRRGLAAGRIFSAARMARMLSGIALLTAFILFQGTFTSIKNALPIFRGGYLFDTLQADIDAAIHFDADPWRWLYAVGAHDAVRTIVEWNYNVLWFTLCFGALFFVATSPRAAAIRTRYIVCYMLVWIVLGSVLAGLFISAGPAFYGAVTGDLARFGPQLDFLAHGGGSAHSAATYQHYLWTLHATGKSGFGSGISAFPSVHVGLITMNALFLHDYSRKLGAAAFAYVGFVMASSVYLAWHYAIDGYAAIAVTAVIFYAASAISARSAKPASRTRSPQDTATGLTAS